MMKGLIGKKIGMTQIFDESGAALPVTLIEAGPCYVTQIRNPERDGYSAVQLGFGETDARRLASGRIGHLKRNDLPPLRYLREFRVKNPELKEGDQVTVETFAIGDRVDVMGTSKGKGFAGGMKRHGFGGGPITHGRVFKGTRMAGHMGVERVTAQNLRVEMVDPERNLLAVHGSVPGGKGGLVFIQEARKQTASGAK
jgi:large subunit ribosomal protein L3